MNLNRISLVSLLLNLIQLCSLECNAHKNKWSTITPCFEDGEKLSTCPSQDDSCEKASGFKLVRLQGIRVSGGLDYYSPNRLGNNTIISFVMSVLTVGSWLVPR